MMFFAYLLFFAPALLGMADSSPAMVQARQTISFFDRAAYEAYPMLFTKLRGQIQQLSCEQRKELLGDLENLALQMTEKAPPKILIYGDLLARFSLSQGPTVGLITYLRDYCTVSEYDCSMRAIATAVSITLGGISIMTGWGSEPRKRLFAYTISEKIAVLAAAIKNNQMIGESGIVA